MNKRSLAVSNEALSAIEAAVQEPRFFGIPMGTTLNDWLIVKLAFGLADWSWRALAKHHIHYYYRRWVPRRGGLPDYSQFAGRLCATWLFNRVDLKALVVPVVEAFGPNEVFVTGPEREMARQLPAGTHFLSWDDLPAIPMHSWRREFDRCAPIWRRQIIDVLDSHRIPHYILPNLMDVLQTHTRRVTACRLFIRHVKPYAIVTEYDRNAHASCLILAAREYGIPCFTMIHGAVEPSPSFGYTPLLADYAFCWGERQKAQLLSLGARPESLLITGCQRLSRTVPASRKTARAKVALPLDKPVIVFASSTIGAEHKTHCALVYCSALADVREVTAVVRLHPAEKPKEYQELIERFPSVTFLANAAWTMDETMAASDVVVNVDSSFGNDALVKGRPVVILDVLPMELKNGKELVEAAGCPRVQSADELKQMVLKILSDDKFRQDLHEKAEIYVKSYCARFGSEAVDAVVERIKALTPSRGTYT